MRRRAVSLSLLAPLVAASLSLLPAPAYAEPPPPPPVTAEEPASAQAEAAALTTEEQVGLVGPQAASAVATAPLIDTAAPPAAYGAALQVESGTVTGATFVTRPPSGLATAVLNGPLAGFPRHGDSAVLLTSGDARLASADNTSTGSGAVAGNGRVRGNSDFDVTVLRVDLAVPANVNCLVGFDFRFLSEEYPEYVGSPYNDGFIAELDRSTWRTSGSTLEAPDNFAFDPDGRVISINSSGSTSMSATEAAGTTYDGATPLLSAATPITPGPHALYLSVFDQGDAVLDSAVLVDNLRFGRVADPATQCVPGARVAVDGLATSALLGSGNPASNISPACHADPVNCATGNFWLSATDVAFAGRSTGVAWSRTYNSLAAGQDGPYGRGWSSTLGMRAERLPDGGVLVHQENGSTLPFTPEGGGFTAPEWVLASLSTTADGGLELLRRGDTSFRFDTAGRLVEVEARSGEVERITRNEAGQAVSVTSDGGAVARFRTDAAGRVTAIEAPGGRTTSLSYDGDGELVSVTDPAGATTRYDYAAAHLLVAVTDPSGAVTRNTYDAQSRVVEQVNALGGVIAFAYEGADASSRTTLTDAEGQVTVEEFEGLTLRSRTVAAGTPAARTTTYAVDSSTLATTAVTDALGRVVTYTYDAAGDLTAVVSPDGATSTASYDDDGDLVALTDPLGHRVELGYDDAGRILSSSVPTAAGTAVTRLERAGADPSDVTAAVDALGRRSAFRLTAEGLVAAVTRPSGAVDTYEHDAAGNVIEVRSAAKRTQRYTYDEAGRVLTATTPAGRVTRYVYDRSGRLVSQTGPSGETTTVTHDALGNVVSVRAADGRVRRNTYDDSGRLVTATDFAGRVTTYGHDAADQVVSEDGPLGRTTHRYDAAGQRISTTDPAGGTTTYAYDAAGRVTRIEHSDGSPALTYTYDAAGRLVGTGDGTGSSTSTYDAAGRLLEAVDGSGARVGYGYDLAGQLTALTYPDGGVVRRGYDADGLVTAVTDMAGRRFGFTYDADGQLTGQTAPNGTSTTHTRDVDGALTGTAVSRGAASLLALSWNRDANGLLADERSSGAGAAGPRAFAHDATGRLTRSGTSATGDGLTEFAYDAADQLLQVRGPGAHRADLGYDQVTGALTELVRSTGGSDPARSVFTSDALGRRVGETSPHGTETFTWSQAGLLTAYSGPAGGADAGVDPSTPRAGGAGPVVTAAYSYDARGLRTSSTTGARTTTYTYDTTADVPLLLTAGDLRFVHGPGGRAIEQVAADGSFLVLHADQLGSTRLVTDAAGKAVQAYEYSAYGAVTVKQGNGSPVTPVMWAGALRDAESGLLYLHARYYDPASAQFLSVDPLVALSHTAYAYAFASPLALVDPLGLFPWDAISVGLSLVSAGTGMAAVIVGVTGVGLPLAGALTVVSIATGAGAAAIDCRDGITVGCGISAASLALGGGGAVVGALGRAGRISGAVGQGVDIVGGTWGAHVGLVGAIYGTSLLFGPGSSSSTGGAGSTGGGAGTQPTSGLYDPADPCYSW